MTKTRQSTLAVIAKVDCRVFVISALYKTKQAILPRQNNQISFGFGKNIQIYICSRSYTVHFSSQLHNTSIFEF